MAPLREMYWKIRLTQNTFISIWAIGNMIGRNMNYGDLVFDRGSCRSDQEKEEMITY